MEVYKKSMMSSSVVSMDLPVTEKQLEQYQNRAGAVQDIFPGLCAGEREFLMNGTTPKEWKKMFGRCGNGTCHKKCKHLKRGT
jgi:hypothetical protein